MLNREHLSQAIDVSTAQGVNLSMLILHLIPVIINANTGDFNPLMEIINKPATAAVSCSPIQSLC